jgi:hypothetical protein
VTVVSEDVQEQLEAEKAERIKYPFARGQMENNTFYSAWRTLDEIDEHMDWLRETAPFGLDIDDIVVGETNEGRPIRGVRMSSPRGPGTEELPKVFMHGCHHSGEWITAMGTVYFFEQLVTGYASDAEITALLERFEWILVPVVNVDGFEFGWSNDAFRTWRKTRSVHPENLAAFAECELTTPGNCEGCFGTDPNRNWDFQWATVGASANPCSNSYHGPSAFSEAETVAVSEFARELNTGDRTLALYIDHHCCGDMYLQPYGALPELPVHHAAIDELGAIGKAATDAKCSTGSSPGTSPSGCDYRQGPIYTTIYPASGSSVDYMCPFRLICSRAQAMPEFDWSFHIHVYTFRTIHPLAHEFECIPPRRYAVNDIIYSYGTEMRSSNGNGPAVGMAGPQLCAERNLARA